MKNPGHKKLHLIITKSNWGGAQRYVFDLATHLKNSYDVSVIAGGEGEMITRLKDAGVHVISIPFLKRDVSLLDDIKTGYFLWKLFKKEKPDIVHLNSSKIGAIGSFAARLAHVPKVIFTLHGLALNESRGLISKTIIRIIYWFTLLFSHTTIAVSNALAWQSALHFPFVSRKVVIVKNGITPPTFIPNDEARALLNLDASKFIFGIIAELHPIKGHLYLLQGFHSFLKKVETPQNYHLAIIGEGSERKHIESFIASHGLENYVTLCGHVTQASRYLKALDVFVLSSLSEGLAYVIQEAGSAGLPVIATNVGGLPEMIIDHETGLLVEPKKPEAIANAMHTLIHDTTLREKIAMQLNQKIETEFSLESMVTQTEKHY